MSLLRRLVYTAALAMCSLTAAGCEEASFAPTSPSTTATRPGSAVSGAIITGTVIGLAPATSRLSEGLTAAATTKPVTVTVVGTSISTVIDGSGRFQLDGVPPGDVRLRFTATGLDATLTLVGVQAGDRIDIKVRVTDTSVRIDAERRDRDNDDEDDEDDDNKLKGTVSNLSGTCPTLTFIVNGTTVKTSSATKFELVCSGIANGVRIEVEGGRQGGTVTATKVEHDD